MKNNKRKLSLTKEKDFERSTKSLPQDFEKHLQKLEDPNYEGGTYVIDKNNASSLEKSKYELCQKLLIHYKEKNLTVEQMAKKIQLSQAETEDILHCWIDKFTLDRLVSYANRVFVNLELGITRI